MKRIIFLIAITFFASCTKDNHSIAEKNQIVGKWKLIEQLNDPGGGTGLFQGVNSQKSIEIFVDSTLTSNGDLCSMNQNVTEGTTGVYNNDYDIITNQCPDIVGLKMELSGENLIIHHPCFEPCAEKYVRIE